MSQFGAAPGLTILGMGRALPEWRVGNEEVLALAIAGSSRLPTDGWLDGSEPRRGAVASAMMAAGGASESPTEHGSGSQAAGRSPAGTGGSLTADAIRKLSGVQTRYWTHAPGQPADHTETTAQDLAIEAVRRAIADSGLPISDIDGILLATTSAPRPSGNTAGHVAKALGLGGFALEFKAGCASAVYGLVMAASLLQLGARNLVLVASEAWTKLAPAGLPGPMAVAGDGAAAVVLGRGDGGFLGGALLTAPEHAAAMMPPGLYPPTVAAIAAGDYQIRLSEDVSELVRDFYPRILDEALAAAGLTRNDVALFIPHQASGPIVRRAMRDCDLPPDRTFHTLERYGNASSASVLLSLHDARAEGRLKPGDVVALFAVGGGISAAGAVLRV